MNAVGTIQSEGTALAVLDQNETEPDLLHREAFVTKLLEIVELLSNGKKNACFALNGKWGVGKTFVLKMFEKEAEEYYQAGTTMPRYQLFRFNCWEYDYYEEPLEAILSFILEELDKKINLISKNNQTNLMEILKAIGMSCIDVAVAIMENKAGLNNGEIQRFKEILKTGITEGGRKAEKEKKFDEYQSFKKALKGMRKSIEALAEYQTVVFIVDELDRCLPEYAVKVLERLHHLCSGISNVQVIFSIDTEQLEHMITEIFGEGTDTKKYLQKFIQFELKLDAGDFQGRFKERFSHYSECFTENSIIFPGDTDYFRDAIMQGIDMRRRIELTERCEMLHMMLIASEEYVIKEKNDPAFLCLELFLAVLHDCRLNIEMARDSFSIDSLFLGKNDAKEMTAGLLWMSEEYNRNHDVYVYSSNGGGTLHVDASTLLGSLLRVYLDILQIPNEVGYTDCDRNAFLRFGQKFWSLLDTVS